MIGHVTRHAHGRTRTVQTADWTRRTHTAGVQNEADRTRRAFRAGRALKAVWEGARTGHASRARRVLADRATRARTAFAGLRGGRKAEARRTVTD